MSAVAVSNIGFVVTLLAMVALVVAVATKSKNTLLKAGIILVLIAAVIVMFVGAHYEHVNFDKRCAAVGGQTVGVGHCFIGREVKL